MDTSGIEPDSFRKATEAKWKTNTMWPFNPSHPDAIWSLFQHLSFTVDPSLSARSERKDSLIVVIPLGQHEPNTVL